jgi:hypothetical protein
MGSRRTRRTVKRWGAGITELEAKRLVSDGRDSNITLDEFHHFH